MIDVRAGDHTATAIHGVEEFAANTAPFARSALTAGAEVMVIPTDEGRGALDAYLDRDATLRDAVRAGRIRVGLPEQARGVDGTFDPNRLRRVYAEATRRAVGGGHSGLWVSVDMGETVTRHVEPATLVAFESGSFPLFSSAELTAMCQYDLRTFPAEVILAARRAHPRNGRVRLRHEHVGGHSWRLSGETDLANRTAWDALVDAIPDGDDVDITAMVFMDAHAVRRLALVAMDRPGMTVIGTEAHARLLRLAGLARRACSVQVSSADAGTDRGRELEEPA